MPVRPLLFLALMVAALSLGPSYAHVLEAPPRLMVWSPELWREATVFNQQFAYFAWIGGPMDLLAIALPAFAAMTLRGRPGFAGTLAGALLFAAALLVWFLVVAGANAVLATWRPGPIPAEFEAIRSRWEWGHIAVAAIKLAGLACLVLAALRQAPLPRRA